MSIWEDDKIQMDNEWLRNHEALKVKARAKLETMPDDEIREGLVKAGYDTAKKDFVCSDGRIDTMGREQMINLAVSSMALTDWCGRLSTEGSIVLKECTQE